MHWVSFFISVAEVEATVRGWAHPFEASPSQRNALTGRDVERWGQIHRLCSRTATRVANDLHFGTVWVNEHLPLVSEMPHSGHKMSGYGHSMSRYNLEQYTQTKHIMIRHDS